MPATRINSRKLRNRLVIVPDGTSEWSAPLRAAEGKALSPLPNEIYFEIFECVAHAHNWAPKRRTESLANLSLVCSFFRAVAIPKLFRSLRILGPPESAVSKLFKLIRQRREPALSLACHIQDCTFERLQTHSPAAPHRKTLSRLPNLQSLTLRNVHVDTPFLNAICHLGALKSLFLDSCPFQFSHEDILDSPRLALQEFSLIRPDFAFGSIEQPWHVIDGVVDTKTLKCLTLSGFQHVESVAIKIDSSALEELVLGGVTSLPILWRILGTCKSLKTLKVESIPSPETTNAPLPPSSIPLLQKLSCPSSMLCLVAGRPISSIDVTIEHNIPSSSFYDMVTKGISNIRQSSATLTDVSVPLHYYSREKFIEILPSFKRLHVYMPKWVLDSGSLSEKVIPRGAKNQPVAKTLVCLSFGLIGGWHEYCHFIDTATQHHILTLLKIAFPNLLNAQLVKGVQWHRQTAHDKWIGDVPVSDHGFVRSLDWKLLRFGGVLERFIDEAGLIQTFRNRYPDKEPSNF